MFVLKAYVLELAEISLLEFFNWSLVTSYALGQQSYKLAKHQANQFFKSTVTYCNVLGETNQEQISLN